MRGERRARVAGNRLGGVGRWVAALPRRLLAPIAALVVLAAWAAVMATGARGDDVDSTHVRVPVVMARPGGPVKPPPAPEPERGSAGTAGSSPTVVRGVIDLSKHPRFTGTWKLSKTKSKFGSIPGGTPTARTDMITHAEPRIVQALYMLNGAHRDTTVYRYLTTGEPTVNAVGGRDIKSVVTWEAATLHLVSTTKLLVFDMQLDERWRLSADGRTLTMTRHVKYPMGEGDQTLVFERQ